MKKILLIIITFSFLYLHAQNPFAVYPISDFDYDYLEAWLTLGGKTAPSDSYPLTGPQIQSILEFVPASIAPDSLLEALEAEMNLDTTNYEKGLDAAYNLDLFFELYLQSNIENLNREYAYKERTAPFSFSLQGFFLDTLQLYVDLDPKQEHMLDKSKYHNFMNIWTSFTDFDFELPHQSFVAIGDDYWYIKLGRDRLQWGPSRTGGLSLSDTADYFDHLIGALTWNGFTYSTTWIHLDPFLTTLDIANYSSIVDNYSIVDEIPVKNFFAHRMELRPLENLSISLIEEIIYGGKYPTLEVLNPVGIFHSTFDFDNLNINLEISTKWVPVPGLLVFGTFVADQINGPSEPGTNDIPSAYGYQTGIHYYQPFSKGYFMAGTEYSHTDPWMYMEHDTLTQFFTRRHVISETKSIFINIDQSIGFPFGPDANFWLNWAEYVSPGVWKAGLSFSWLQKGSVDFNSKYEWTIQNAAMTTPSGPNPITRWSTEIYGEYSWKGLTAKVRVYFLNFENYDHIAGNTIFDVQAALSAGWTFTF